ncbi:LRR receptor-like serine/threonine-protein kinase FLS2 [Vigna radiata var. radiata]|uniref:LRR receptor-like serine/threonine-protein kinase FLS2 n=1 Tax=Vigna radiata var. radiata TaxID=3916 RepID=A0A1S3U0F7_VIGRR|nr:LRR receptor-like serine/threonine-protein kinase FLS2 [Vigna radiata var. radiata]
MTAYFLKTVYLLLLLSFLASEIIATLKNSSESGEAKCIERERQALLSFKEGLIDNFGMLSTWTNNTDSCKWKRVQCNIQTGHVQLLDLHGNYRSIPLYYLRGAINVTSLIHLPYIQHLDLNGNYFELSYIPEFMGSITNLRYLDLSSSYFAGRIPSILGNLLQLRYLDLRENLLWGKIPIEIGNLKHLQYLDLGLFYLSGKIPSQIANLRKLQHLSLGSNIPLYVWRKPNYISESFSGEIPFRIGNLPLLHTLRLVGNFDVQAKDTKWLSTLHSLTILELSSLHSLKPSHQWLQTIGKIIPNLTELRLVDCNLLHSDIQSLFHSHSSNNYTSLTILDLSSNMLSPSILQFVSNFSLHLQELYLSHNNITLSPSLCANFPSLKVLDLSYNYLASSMFRANFNISSKLQELYLENCSLMDENFLLSSTSTMNSLSSLIYLDLSNNFLKSSPMFYWLFNFTTNLHFIDLNGNLLEGPIPDEFGKAMNSLAYLCLHNNKLQGKIPSFLGSMCRLQILDLSNNKLNGEFPSFTQNSSWCSRHIFRGLNLSYNQINGRIPESIRQLSQLEILSLQGNSLEGDVTESHLSNFSKLIFLDFSHNSLSVKFSSSWVPPFQLAFLLLASCKVGPSFPSWIQTQNSLIHLDISNNMLNDFVPEWFWNQLKMLYSLNMSHNNLIGSIPNMQSKLPFRPSIILSSNEFEGKVPLFLLQASELLLSANKFSDFSCGNVTAANLATLDLSNNQIKGQLPDCWKSTNQLLFLDISSNELSGKLPISMGSLVNLEALVLRNNSLLGELPPSLKNCKNLIMLDVSQNMLSGPMPSWFGESMQQLIILILGGNHFSGKIPLHLCYLKRIQLLDLSKNKLSEEIPPCLNNFTALSEKIINRVETESRVYWYNSTYYEIYNLLSYSYSFHITWMWKGMEHDFTHPELTLLSIDLSCNNLIGEIPKEITHMLGLVSLNLSRNNLSGEIPSDIGYLSSLESLDLSRNQLYGRIPSSLSQMDFLQNLDLSHNSLSGRIPLARHMDTFDASCFEGNIDLCGEQLNKSCAGDQTLVKPQKVEVHGEYCVFYEALYMSLGIGFFTGFWGLLGPLLLWQPWRMTYLRFLNRLIDYLLVMVEVNLAKPQR